jgi:hypothetical protein
MVKVVLGRHCIEGASRERYQELVQELLDGKLEPEDVQDSLELLEDFLKAGDFPALRTHYPDLDGRREVEVQVERTDEGFVVEWDRGRVVVEAK